MNYVTDEQRQQMNRDHAQAQRKAARDSMIERRSAVSDAPKTQYATDQEAWAAKQAVRAEWLARRGQ